jgi:hypothetical protein
VAIVIVVILVGQAQPLTLHHYNLASYHNCRFSSSRRNSFFFTLGLANQPANSIYSDQLEL